MTQFASSNFNGTDGTLLPAFDANWVSQTGTSGTSEILSNRAANSSVDTSSAYYYNAAPASADYEVSADLYNPGSLGTSSAVGPIGRALSTASTFYHVRYNATTSNVQLISFVGGTATVLGSSSQTAPASGASTRAKLGLAGSTITAFWGDMVTPVISVTNTALTTAGFPGLRYFSSSLTASFQLDNFSADEAGGGATIVTTSQSGSWSVRNGASASQAAAWSVRNPVSTTQAAAWSVRNAVSTTQPGAWSSRNYASATQSGSWSVLEAGIVTAAQASAWTVRNIAAATQAGAWSVLEAGVASATQSGSWSVRNLVAATQPSAWSIRNSAQATAPGAWSVRNAVQATQAGAWSVNGANLATAVQPGSWSVRGLIAANQSGAWSVLSDQSPVTYPLSGIAQSYPLAGVAQTYPLSR